MAENKTKSKSSKRPVIPKNLEKFPDFPKQKVDQSDYDFKSEIVQYWKKKKKEKRIKAMRQLQKKKKIDRQTNILRDKLQCCFPKHAQAVTEFQAAIHHFLNHPGMSLEGNLLRLMIMKQLKHVCANNPSDDEKNIKSKEEFHRAMVSTFQALSCMHDLKTFKIRAAILLQPEINKLYLKAPFFPL